MTRLCCYFAMCLATLLLLGGCSAKPMYGGYDGYPARDYDGAPRSLALDSDRQVELTAERPPGDAWWIDRRDRGPVAYGGLVSARREISVTYTRDSQYISGGQVYDRYRQTTFRRSVRESSR